MRDWDRTLGLAGGALALAALATSRLELLPWGLSLMMVGPLCRFFALARSKRAQEKVEPTDD